MRGGSDGSGDALREAAARRSERRETWERADSPEGSHHLRRARADTSDALSSDGGSDARPAIAAVVADSQGKRPFGSYLDSL